MSEWGTGHIQTRTFGVKNCVVVVVIKCVEINGT